MQSVTVHGGDVIQVPYEEESMSNYERCKECPYYFGEIDSCMYGEDDVPLDLQKKCEEKNNEQNNKN